MKEKMEMKETNKVKAAVTGYMGASMWSPCPQVPEILMFLEFPPVGRERKASCPFGPHLALSLVSVVFSLK